MHGRYNCGLYVYSFDSFSIFGPISSVDEVVRILGFDFTCWNDDNEILLNVYIDEETLAKWYTS